MTASKIAQVASMLNSPEFLQAQKQSQEQEIAFGTFLNYAASPGGEPSDLFSGRTAEKSAKLDTVNQTAYEKETVKSSYRENSISRSDNSDAQNKMPEDAQEKLKDFESQVKEAVSEKLGISQEELTAQMEAMGLTVLDLMNPSKLAGLVMDLTGSQDIGGLLLNEDFQQLLGQISELSQELAFQLNLTPEEMVQVLPQLEQSLSDKASEIVADENADVMIEQADTVTEENVSQNPAETAQVSVQAPANESEVHKEAPQEVSTSQKQEQAAGISIQDGEEQQDSGESSTDTDSAKEESYSKLTQDAKGTGKAENHQTQVTYQTTTQTINQGQSMEVTQTVVQTKINVDDILRQVSQMTRVIVGQAESSIEMQLNPANLGKVYLQVISREGVITAQLAAQNEAVKEALESQLVVLKDNMEQQGMKVEAVEVTIASHEFERNLEENQHGNAQEQQEEAQRSARRNLNLNNLDELEGLMTEEENLAAKIMAEQGNRMDVTI
ncbi:flagellar hook-length control protein FliK [Lachnospiraceae bacterium 45-W7]